MKWTAPLCALALTCVACGDDGNRTTSTTANVTMSGGTITASGGSTGAASATTGDSPTEATTSATSGTSVPATDDTGMTTVPKFDVAETGDVITTGAPDMGCKKVDFLFVIDNSASMEDNQAALIASFPGFIDAIQNKLTDADDYHVMVVDSDDDGRCKQPCNMGNANVMEFCAKKMYHACTTELDVCDTTRGAGVVHPVGLFATNAVCPIAGGNRYILPEEPDLLGTFACVATVGTAGNPSERPMNGLTEALSPVLNGPGGCNAGFLRDDAILVITFLSDDPNYEDEGTPQDWFDAVVAAKQGNKDAIVVAGLIPQPAMGCGGGGPTNGTHWAEFLAMWGERGIPGSICEPDYAPFFAQAVEVISETCENFTPPG